MLERAARLAPHIDLLLPLLLLLLPLYTASRSREKKKATGGFWSSIRQNQLATSALFLSSAAVKNLCLAVAPLQLA
jgi:hypothetical protein